jgi:hypothetical protein
MLESVVMLNWAEVMPKTAGGLVDVEYRFLPDKSLEYLRLWACSERRFCDLICQYSMFWHWSLTQNVSLGKGYNSQGLVDSLGYVIQHPDQFASKAGGMNKLVQVSTPSANQVEMARQFVAAIVN